jgi:hypothetical protein
MPLVIITEKQAFSNIYAANRDAEVIVAETADDVRNIINGLVNGHQEDSPRGPVNVATISGETVRYQTILIDGLTHIHKLMARDRRVNEEGQEKMSMKRWGQVNRDLETFLDFLRGFPANVVCTALVIVDDGRLRPQLFGKAPNWVGGYFSAVGFAHKGGEQVHQIGWDLGDWCITKRPAGSGRILPSITLSGPDGEGATLGSIMCALYPDVPVARREQDDPRNIMWTPGGQG